MHESNSFLKAPQEYKKMEIFMNFIIIILYSEWNWNGGPRGYPYYRASYLTTFKYYLQLIKFENFTTKKKEHARDTI